VRTYLDHYADIWSSEGLSAYLERNFNASRLRRELEPDSGIEYFVLHDGERDAGFAKVAAAREAPGGVGVIGTEIEKIYFLREATGRGHGATLMRHLLAYAAERGERLAWLDVLKTNQGGQRFYERLGFERRGEIPFRTDLFEIGMWIMTRALED
jgi:ribosomal protein S18 acetylase RimI-like enzyme